MDRRVDVLVAYALPRPVIAKVEDEDEAKEVVEEFDTGMADFYERSKMPLQEFCIDPNRDTTLRCEKGSIIHIKAGSFKLNRQHRKSQECIAFQVKEAFLHSEMILENLNTTSDGRILETQGMVFTNAMLGKDTLSLVKNLTILLPTDSIVDGVKVFNGERDLHSNAINWSVNNNSVLRDFSVVDIADCLKYNDLWKKCNSRRGQLLVDVESQKARCIHRMFQCLKLDECERCKLLFCRAKRIGRPFRGIFNKRIRNENRELRGCQKFLRRSKRYGIFSRKMRDWLRERFVNRGKGKKGKLSEREQEILELLDVLERSDAMVKGGKIDQPLIRKCDQLDSLFNTYAVDNTEDLILALNKPLLDEFGVSTIEALLDTLPKVNLENIEIAYKSKTITYDDYKFYIFNASKLGWTNLDIFADLKEEDLTKITINTRPTKQVDCKIIFKERKFVIPAKLADQHFYFEGIPKGEEAWLIGLQFKDDKPMLSMERIVVEGKAYELDFKHLSMEELKERLRVLDF